LGENVDAVLVDVRVVERADVAQVDVDVPADVVLVEAVPADVVQVDAVVPAEVVPANVVPVPANAEDKYI
jgi:hypothetical protein